MTLGTWLGLISSISLPATSANAPISRGDVALVRAGQPNKNAGIGNPSHWRNDRCLFEFCLRSLSAPHSLADLTACLATMKDCLRQGDLLAAAREDFGFHDIIVTLSGNRLFKEIHNMNRDAILESQKLPLARHKRLWEPAQEHSRILEAFEQRDPDGAAYLMQLHIIRAADRVGLSLRP